MSSTNTIQGRLLLLEILDNGVFKIAGGIKTKNFSRSNPVSDVTNQNSLGGETEAAYNGYSTVTLNGNGTADTRQSATAASYKQLAVIANSTDPSATFRLSDPQESYTGEFLITEFGKTAEQNGQVEFSIAMQNKGVVAYV